MDFERLIPIIRRLALEAGDRIMQVYNGPDFEVKAKGDTSPVTEADEAADALISAGLRAAYPDLVLIVAHMGLPDYARFLDLVEKYDNVHLDTTMAFTAFTEASTPFPAEELPRLKALGERVLFGSDFPNIPYPYLEAVDAVLGLGLGDDWVRGVLHENAARLFGLSSGR